MHFAIGLLSLAVVLTFTVRLGHDARFDGLIHIPSMFLLALAPLSMAVISYKGSELLMALRSLWHALRFDPIRSRTALYEELNRFATEVRMRKPAEALAVAEHASHDLLRQLGPLVVRQYSSAALEETASAARFVQASNLKRSEDVFNTLAKVAPATGLVGTVLGLISLLKELSNFEQLGPSMALALLCTFYGLLLANGFYSPLARIIHTRMSVVVEESKLLTQALVLLTDGKPLSDLRKLFGVNGSTSSESDAPVSVALGGGR